MRRVLIALPSPVMRTLDAAADGVQATTRWARRERRFLTNCRPRHWAGSSCSRQQVHASLCGFVFAECTLLLAWVMAHNAPSPAHAYTVTGTVMLRAKTSEDSLPAVVRLALLVPLEDFMEQLQCLPGKCGLFSRNSHCTPLLPNHSRMFAANSLRDPILCAMRL